MRRILAALALAASVIGPAQAQTTVSGPITFATGLSVSGTGAVSVSTSQSGLTCSSCTLSSPTVTGGTINNTVIGGSTPAAATFTTVVATSSVEGSGGTTQLNSQGFTNNSSSSYGLLNITTSGPTISRNEADANPTFTINNMNASSTGDILDMKNSGGLVASVSQAGVANFTAGLAGVATNSNAATGIIGQYVSADVAAGSAVALTSGTPANVTSISLSAGDWDVSGTVAFAPAGTTTTTSCTAAIGTSSATVPTLSDTAPVAIDNASLGAGLGRNLSTGTARLSLSTTTTVYLVAESTFATSTSAAYGFIRARRVR